jgi:hypothetical protein
MNILTLHGTSNMLPAQILVASFLVGFALGYATRAALAQTSRALSDVCTLYVQITHTRTLESSCPPGRLASASISVNRQDT